jgi:hypothetical protein
MSARPLAAAAIATMLFVAPLTAQDPAGPAPTSSIFQPQVLVVGLLRPTFSGADAPDAGARTGFVVGVRSHRRMNRRTRLELGADIASRGARESNGSFSATTSTINIEVPVAMRFKVNDANAPTPAPRVFFSALGGVLGSFNVSCSTSFESSGSTSSSDCTDNSAMDIAAMLGGGANFVVAGRNAGLDVVFTQGFMPVFKDFEVNNRSIGVIFRIGLAGLGSSSSSPTF